MKQLELPFNDSAQQALAIEQAAWQVFEAQATYLNNPGKAEDKNFVVDSAFKIFGMLIAQLAEGNPQKAIKLQNALRDYIQSACTFYKEAKKAFEAGKAEKPVLH
jgi:hypothetical protein